jgi:hypothetical protein
MLSFSFSQCLQLHHRVLKQLERHLARDRVVPSPQHVIAITCLRALTALALSRDRLPDHAARCGRLAGTWTSSVSNSIKQILECGSQ